MNFAGGASVPSVSSSDSYEVVNDETVGDSFPAQPSPRLGAILTKYGSSLREGAFVDSMQVSIMDLGYGVDDSFFTARGKIILREAERASMEAMSGAAQVSAMNKAMDPSSPAVRSVETHPRERGRMRPQARCCITISDYYNLGKIAGLESGLRTLWGGTHIGPLDGCCHAAANMCDATIVLTHVRHV